MNVRLSLSVLQVFLDGVFSDVIIVIGGAYHVTVDRCIITANMEICPDTVSRFYIFRRVVHQVVVQRSREIRWTLGFQNGRNNKSWTYLRFGLSTDLTRFARELFAAFDAVTTKYHLVHNRIYDIAYAEPSNFTNYCREYLGQEYFDALGDSDIDESQSETDEDGTMVQGYEVD